MARLEDIIAEKNERLFSVPEKFLTQVEKEQRRVFDQLAGLLGRLDRDKEGHIRITRRNLTLIDDIIDSLQRSMTRGDYARAVRAFVGEFDQQAKINNSYFRKAFEDFDGSPVAETLLEQAKMQAAELLVQTPIRSNFLDPLRQQIETLVTSGADFKDGVKLIRDFVEGGGDASGKLLRYAKQVAHDMYAMSDASYTNILGDELDAEWYLYSGGLIKDSRDFCRERNGKYFHFREVEAWGDIKSWQGRMPNTNEQTIFINRGGFNCKHSIMPVSISIVPKAVVERNVRNGNYVPG